MPTGIDWTEETWNPSTGCTKCSPGCKNCYAEPLALRLQRMNNPRYQKGFDVSLHWDVINKPKGFKKPTKFFVNSMSDLFHKEIPDSFIKKCFDMMRECSHHEFQILTKRFNRWPTIENLVGSIPSNVFAGVSIEDRRHLRRLDGLKPLNAKKMVSIEPLLEDLGDPIELASKLEDAGINWVITGGESGWNARPAQLDWFRSIRDACKLASIPFFHKQHGGKGTSHKAKRGGEYAILDGVVHQEYPTTNVKPQVQSSLF